MASLADFERFVAPYVNGAPVPAIHDAVLDASIEFCIKTKALRSIVDPITLTRGVFEYEIDPPEAGTQIADVLTAWLPEGKINPLTRPDLDAMYPAGWANLTVSQTELVQGFYCPQPGYIRLVPAMDQKAARALILEVSYAPEQIATTLPDILLNRYAETIATGALARLHQHNAPYADPSRAISYMQRFDFLCSSKSDESTHGFHHQPLRVISEE